MIKTHLGKIQMTSQDGEDCICIPSAGFQLKSQSCEGLRPFSGGHMQHQWESDSRNPWSFAVPSRNTNKIRDYVKWVLWRGELIPCLATLRSLSCEEVSRIYCNLPLSFCCRRWRGESVLQLLERWSPQTHLQKTAESTKKKKFSQQQKQPNSSSVTASIFFAYRTSCECTRMDPPSTAHHHCLCNTWGGKPHPEWCPGNKQKEVKKLSFKLS